MAGTGGAAAGYVVIADFRARPDRVVEFAEAARRHARNSLAHEPGCLQFDVVQDPADPARVTMYEVYRDEAAFAEHEASPHLAQMRPVLGELAAERVIRKLSRIEHPRKPPAVAGKVLVAVASLARRREHLRPLEEAGLELALNPHGLTMTREQMAAALPGVVATIAGGEAYDEGVLAAADRLRVVARVGVGFDRIDVPAATRKGVAVAMAFGTNHDAVADFAFSLMAALAHRIPDYDRGVREGAWGGFFQGGERGHARLHGTTVGIVGFGRIGRALAKRCQGFGMDALVADPVMDVDTVRHLGCRLVPLDELLAASDFVSLHAPLGPETRGLLDARRIGLMRRSAFLVSTARGGMVDEAALAAALAEGRLAGAGLDVFAREPLERDSPLLRAPNLLLTPHVAGSSEFAIEAMTRRCVESVLAILKGEDPGAGLVLNPEVLAAGARPRAAAL